MTSQLTTETLPKVKRLFLLADTPPNDTVFILGAKGSGKTTLLANLIAERGRFILVDTKNDFDTKYFPGSVEATSLSQLVSQLNKGEKRIIFKFDGNVVTFNWLCRYVVEFQTRNFRALGPVTVGLDELNLFVDVNESPEQFQDLILRGRSIGIKSILASQWFNRVPTWLREQFSEIYVFRHKDPNGLDMLTFFGFDAEHVSNLGKFEALHLTRDNEIEFLRFVAERAGEPRTNSAQTLKTLIET
jgi:energy-coupling factor transporter ATP-binding protein EcfA2